MSWDTNSAPPRHALAVALSSAGRSAEAVTELQAACRLAPRDAEYRYQLGLALSDTCWLPSAAGGSASLMAMFQRAQVASLKTWLASAGTIGLRDHIRTRLAPQVKPPPIASNITRSPCLIRPSRTATSNASGTEAAEVLA